MDLIADITSYTTAPRLSSADLSQRRWDRDRAKPATIAVGDGPRGIAFDGTNIWVANSDDNTVSKIDPTTNTVTATISTGVGSGPWDFAYDGTSVWVTQQNGSVSKINPT